MATTPMQHVVLYSSAYHLSLVSCWQHTGQLARFLCTLLLLLPLWSRACLCSPSSCVSSPNRQEPLKTWKLQDSNTEFHRTCIVLQRTKYGHSWPLALLPVLGESICWRVEPCHISVILQFGDTDMHTNLKHEQNELSTQSLFVELRMWDFNYPSKFRAFHLLSSILIS